MVLLDTHTWIFLIEDADKLTKKAYNRIQKEQVWAISSFSCLEVAMLVHKGRLETGPNLDVWMREATSIHKMEVLGLTPEIAVKAYQLTGFHGDPADRVIVASALVYDIPLITKDEKLRSYSFLKTLW